MSIRNENERWRTIRSAVLGGWGPTLRLLVVIVVIAVAPAVAVWLVTR